jgi:hypothetical protein
MPAFASCHSVTGLHPPLIARLSPLPAATRTTRTEHRSAGIALLAVLTGFKGKAAVGKSQARAARTPLMLAGIIWPHAQPKA